MPPYQSLMSILLPPCRAWHWAWVLGYRLGGHHLHPLSHALSPCYLYLFSNTALPDFHHFFITFCPLHLSNALPYPEAQLSEDHTKWRYAFFVFCFFFLFLSLPYFKQPWVCSSETFHLPLHLILNKSCLWLSCVGARECSCLPSVSLPRPPLSLG